MSSRPPRPTGEEPPSRPKLDLKRRLSPLIVPVLTYIAIRAMAGLIDDGNMVWFLSLFAFRYARLFINLYFFWKYKPSPAPAIPTLSPSDVTVVIPTISVYPENEDFRECLATCLLARPAELIVVTNTLANAESARTCLAIIRQVFPQLRGAGPRVTVLCSNVASKRGQLTHAIPHIKTRLTVFADDHVFLPPTFLASVVPVFEDPAVGLCGTNKTVRRRAPSAARTVWGGYLESYWNVIGALYLHRHNFETRATNASDGGVFVISGRANAVRTSIVQDRAYLARYNDERFLFGLLGPILPDDDNFTTRWVMNEGWRIKVQHTDEARIETTLGEYPKFVHQCLRWSRTTIRSNFCSLLTDRTVWSEWPITTWTSLIPCLFNFALLWDAGIVYAFSETKLCSESPRKLALLACLGAWIYFAKLVKLVGYFKDHPLDFFLFFWPLPAYHLFAYFHSFLKLWTYITFWDCGWSGRSFEVTESKDEVASEQEKPIAAY
jgi:cellulose synthase/poly-beta-1,6-N-acetylglucosamine synthase-like glycosyltransferase